MSRGPVISLTNGLAIKSRSEQLHRRRRQSSNASCRGWGRLLSAHCYSDFSKIRRWRRRLRCRCAGEAHSLGTPRSQWSVGHLCHSFIRRSSGRNAAAATSPNSGSALPAHRKEINKVATRKPLAKLIKLRKSEWDKLCNNSFPVRHWCWKIWTHSLEPHQYPPSTETEILLTIWNAEKNIKNQWSPVTVRSTVSLRNQ